MPLDVKTIRWRDVFNRRYLDVYTSRRRGWRRRIKDARPVPRQRQRGERRMRPEQVERDVWSGPAAGANDGGEAGLLERRGLVGSQGDLPPSVVQPPSFSRSEKHEDRETRVWICGRPSLSRHVDHSTFLDADCEFIGVTRATRASYLEQSTCAVAVVTRLLDRLRVLGVYDDSVIVISSDHGVRLTPEEFVYDEPLPFGDLPAVAGNSRALLAVKTANADGPLRISYAPDGDHRHPGHHHGRADRQAVLFVIAEGFPASTTGQLAVLDLATGDVTRLGVSGVNPQYVSTGHLLYAVEDGSVRAVPFDIASLNITGNPVALLDGVTVKSSGAANFSVSDTGTLAHTNSRRVSDNRLLALVDRNGAVEALNVPLAPYVAPRLSPDGDKLVVETVEDDGGVLWLYDLAGDTQIQQLTFEGDNQRPVWTPDGRRITFSSDREGTMSLYSMPADGSGGAERLTTAEEGTFHWAGSWAPDGQTLLVNVQKELLTDWDIWTMSANGQEMRGGPHPLDRFSSHLRWNPVHDSSGFVCWLSSSPSVSVRLLRRPVIERRVGPAPVVEVHPPTDAGSSLGTGCELGQVDAFVLERSPQPLDEHVVHPAALAVHRDADASLREHVGEVDAGELAALVAIKDLRRAIALERLVQGVHAEARIERVGQAPGQDLAARPVHHRDEVQKASLQWDIGNIRAPHVVRSRDLQIA